MWWDGRGMGALGALGCDLPAMDMAHTKAQWTWEVSLLRVAGDRSLVGSRAASQAAWPSAHMGWSGTPGDDRK